MTLGEDRPVHRLLLSLVGALAVLHVAGVARSQIALLPGIQKVVDSGELTVALIKHDLPPVIVTGKDGKPAGFEADLARAIAKDLGVAPKFVRTAQTYDDVIRLVAEGKADVAISFLSRTPERAKSVLFTRTYLTQKLTALINRVAGLQFGRGCPTIADVLKIAGQEGKLGVQKGTANVARIKAGQPDAKIKEYKSAAELYEAVRGGKVPMSLQGELSARAYLKENPAARIYLKFCTLDTAPDRIGIAVGGGNEDLRRWLDVFLDEHNVTYDAAQVIRHRGPWTF